MRCKYMKFFEKNDELEVIFLTADTRFSLSRGKNSSLPRQEFFPSDEKKEGKVCENFIFSITFVVKSMNDGMSHEPNE